MTLQELQALTTDIKLKTIDLANVVTNLGRFIDGVDGIVNGQFATIIFNTQQAIDNFVTAETTPYVGFLTAIETAADALGTDPFH